MGGGSMKTLVHIEIVDPNSREQLEQLWKKILLEKLCQNRM